MLPNGPDPRPVSLDEAPQPPGSAPAAAAAPAGENTTGAAPGLGSLIALVVAVIALAVVYFVIR